MGPSSRARYGLRALLYLGSQERGRAVPVREIAQKEAVSADYLEHLLHAMKAASLVESVRGASGGFRLAKSPEDIMLKDIFAALGERFSPVWCLKEDEYCPRQGECRSRPLWDKFGVVIDSFLSGTSLADALSE